MFQKNQKKKEKSQWVQGQPGLWSELLSQKTEQKSCNESKPRYWCVWRTCVSYISPLGLLSHSLEFTGWLIFGYFLWWYSIVDWHTAKTKNTERTCIPSPGFPNDNTFRDSITKAQEECFKNLTNPPNLLTLYPSNEEVIFVLKSGSYEFFNTAYISIVYFFTHSQLLLSVVWFSAYWNMAHYVYRAGWSWTCDPSV